MDPQPLRASIREVPDDWTIDEYPARYSGTFPGTGVGMKRIGVRREFVPRDSPLIRVSILSGRMTPASGSRAPKIWTSRSDRRWGDIADTREDKDRDEEWLSIRIHPLRSRAGQQSLRAVVAESDEPWRWPWLVPAQM